MKFRSTQQRLGTRQLLSRQPLPLNNRLARRIWLRCHLCNRELALSDQLTGFCCEKVKERAWGTCICKLATNCDCGAIAVNGGVNRVHCLKASNNTKVVLLLANCYFS